MGGCKNNQLLQSSLSNSLPTPTPTTTTVSTSLSSATLSHSCIKQSVFSINYLLLFTANCPCLLTSHSVYSSLPPVPSPRVKSPPCIMKSLMTRWNLLPLYVIGLPDGSFYTTVQSQHRHTSLLPVSGSPSIKKQYRPTDLVNPVMKLLFSHNDIPYHAQTDLPFTHYLKFLKKYRH